MKTYQFLTGSLIAAATLCNAQGITVTSGTSGQSGLKFANLNSSHTPITNTNTGVLSLNPTGDVVWVLDAGTGTFGGANNGCSASGNVVQLGNAIAGTAAQLTSHREIPQNGFGMLFSGNTATNTIQVGGTFHELNFNSRFFVKQEPYPNMSTWVKGISCISRANSNVNTALYGQAVDHPTQGGGGENQGAWIYAEGQGNQIGARVQARCTAGSSIVHGVEVTAQGLTGSTSNPIGVKASASGFGNETFGVRGFGDGAVNNYGGMFGSENPNPQTTAMNVGVAGYAGNCKTVNRGGSNIAWSGTHSAVSNYGTYSSANDNSGVSVTQVTNTGVYAQGAGSPQSSNCTNYGVHARGTGPASYNYGAYCYTDGSGGENYALYAEATTNGTVNLAGYFKGNVKIVGNLAAGPYALDVVGDAIKSIGGGVWAFSDRRFKKDIAPLTNVSEKIKQLNGYTYVFNAEAFPDRKFITRPQIGLMAQEIQEVFPQLVMEANPGELAVNYEGMIPVLLAAHNEQATEIEKQQTEITKQQAQLDQQQKQINELKAVVESLANTSSGRIGTSGVNTQAVSLSDKEAIVLDQNVPNPFAESTVISYSIPTDFTKAQIIFSTEDGRVVKTVDINEKGDGSLTVFAHDLTHGLYTYTLVIDGKTIDTKKMIKQ
jgi:hypothetical protein